MDFLPIRIMAGLALLSCSIIIIIIIRYPILYNSIAYKLILNQNIGFKYLFYFLFIILLIF